MGPNLQQHSRVLQQTHRGEQRIRGTEDQRISPLRRRPLTRTPDQTSNLSALSSQTSLKRTAPSAPTSPSDGETPHASCSTTTGEHWPKPRASPAGPRQTTSGRPTS